MFFLGPIKYTTVLLILKMCNIVYRNNPGYWDRQAFANSVDPDQTPQYAASDQGLHCLPYIQQYFKHIKRYRMDYWKF